MQSNKKKVWVVWGYGEHTQVCMFAPEEKSFRTSCPKKERERDRERQRERIYRFKLIRMSGKGSLSLSHSLSLSLCLSLKATPCQT